MRLVLFGWLSVFLVFLLASFQIKLKCNTIVAYSQINFSDAIIAAPSVEVGVGVIWVYANYAFKISNGLVVP